MSHILPWLRSQRPQTVAELSSNALTIVVGAFWAITTFGTDFSPSTISFARPASITAVDHDIAGHDFAITLPATIDTRSTIDSEPQKPLEDSLDKLATRLAREKGVEVAPLRTIVAALDRANIEHEDIPQTLESKAAKLTEFRAASDKLRQGPAELAPFAKEAQNLVDESAFDAAREVLVHGREAARGRGSDITAYEADFLAQEASVDDLQLAYLSAAEKYGEAAELATSPNRQWELLDAQARALCRYDALFADNEVASRAIDIYRRALRLVPRSTMPALWVSTKHNLGAALVRLGERESGVARLEEAIANYRDILPDVASDSPIWPNIQMLFGRALFRLGERETGTERLAEAVEVYRVVSKTKLFTSGTFENEHNLGVALITLGERETGSKHLEEAVIVLRGASTAFPRKLFPLHWAKTQNNLGIALVSLGARNRDVSRLEDAIEAFGAALEERSPERGRRDWAASTGYRGVALMLLANLRFDPAIASRALSQIEAALAVAREEGDLASVSYLEEKLPDARALVEKTSNSYAVSDKH
jgi:tetratricopeptide (TPR) repeat protein